MSRSYMFIDDTPQRSAVIGALTGILCVLLFVFVVMIEKKQNLKETIA